MSLDVKQFNFFAIATSVTLLVYLGGATYALVTHAIDFAAFMAAVGAPLGAMTGWAAKSAATPAPEKLLS